MTDRARTSNGAKRSGEFELWVTYKSSFKPEPTTYLFRRYETAEIAAEVGRSLMRKHTNFYTAFDVRQNGKSIS